jgi:hypothetical protein
MFKTFKVILSVMAIYLAPDRHTASSRNPWRIVEQLLENPWSDAAYTVGYCAPSTALSDEIDTNPGTGETENST